MMSGKIKSVILRNVSKEIKDSVVLDDVSLSLESGKIYGLIGRNGSGKTMLLRMLAGLIKPTDGEILYSEVGVGAVRAAGVEIAAGGASVPERDFRVGITIESAQFYPEFTAYKNLQFLAQINDYIDGNDIRNALSDVGLEPDDRRVVRKYSMGMKQRLAIAQAIMERPDLLLLDEPTNALDESGIALIHDLIKEQALAGAIVVIASHSKEDTAILCDELFTMDQGRISSANQVGSGLPVGIPVSNGGNIK